jgi:creatinine amidohydrolase
MDHDEMADHGVIGNPFRATAEKGEQIFDRFSTYLAEAIAELETVKVNVTQRAFDLKA